MQGASGADLLAGLGGGRLGDGHGVVTRLGEHPVRVGVGVRRNGVAGGATDVVEDPLAHAATEGARHEHGHLAGAIHLVEVHLHRAGGAVDDGRVHRVDAEPRHTGHLGGADEPHLGAALGDELHATRCRGVGLVADRHHDAGRVDPLRRGGTVVLEGGDELARLQLDTPVEVTFSGDRGGLTSRSGRLGSRGGGLLGTITGRGRSLLRRDLHRTADFLLRSCGCAGCCLCGILGTIGRLAVSSRTVATGLGRAVQRRAHGVQTTQCCATGVTSGLVRSRCRGLVTVCSAALGLCDGLGPHGPGVGVGGGLDRLAVAHGGGVDRHLVAARFGEHPVGVHVRGFLDRDGARQGGGAAVEQGLGACEGVLREQVHLARALDVTDVDLHLAEAVALDVEGLPTRPQQVGVLRDGQDVSLGGTGVALGDAHECGVLDGQQYILGGVKHTLTGDVLLDLEVEAVPVGRTDSEDVGVPVVEHQFLGAGVLPVGRLLVGTGLGAAVRLAVGSGLLVRVPLGSGLSARLGG